LSSLAEAQALEPVADRIAAMGDFLREEGGGRPHVPARRRERAARVKQSCAVPVLIVGQDPSPRGSFRR
jgi:uracil-DNA glycosylase